jgi:peptide/nickel transport system substrate-binding protein
MIKTLVGALAAAALSFAAVAPVFAQTPKSGGTLRVQHRDNAPSASPHEEATISTVFPFMAVFNNLIMYDHQKALNTEQTIVPDLATSWAWDAGKTNLTFKLRGDVKWHDGKPFTAADVVCTFDKVMGKAKDGFRKNPRNVWFHNLKSVTAKGNDEVTFSLGAPQPGFIHLLAAGYTPIYACHVSSQDVRTKPIGTGPFMFVEWKRNEFIKLAKNPNYFKKGKPHVDAIEFRIIPNRSTRMLSFQAGEFDMTFSDDVTIPLLKDMQAKSPKAICQLRPTNVSTNLIVNRSAPPFDNPKVRQAVSMALDYDAFISILSEGKNDKGGAMLPAPEGQWGLPPDELKKLPGFGDVAKSRAEAKKMMEELGYSADKPLKVKVATRDIAIYRDPAVILIDQLKSIHVAGELEVVDTSIWHAKVARNDYSIGLNLTGAGVDDPDAGLVENYTCNSERNYTKYCNKDVEKLIFDQSKEIDPAKRKEMVYEIQRQLIKDVARPIISYGRLATCMQPTVKGLVLHSNSIYNGWRFEDVWLDK